MVMYALLYLQWITSKDLWYSTWNSAQCYMAAWRGEGSGEKEYVSICVRVSPFIVYLKLSQHY